MITTYSRLQPYTAEASGKQQGAGGPKPSAAVPPPRSRINLTLEAPTSRGAEIQTRAEIGRSGENSSRPPRPRELVGAVAWSRRRRRPVRRSRGGSWAARSTWRGRFREDESGWLRCSALARSSLLAGLVCFCFTAPSQPRRRRPLLKRCVRRRGANPIPATGVGMPAAPTRLVLVRWAIPSVHLFNSAAFRGPRGLDWKRLPDGL